MQIDSWIVRELFETQAFRVSPAEEVFWYTSGQFGPYYINTHFLFENAEKADTLLHSIDYSLKCPLALGRVVGLNTVHQYHQNKTYQRVIDTLAEKSQKYEFDYVSGGARRDFFFSYALAELLGKEHLAILKDGSVFHTDMGFSSSREVKSFELQGARVLHIADLITEGSSYFRAWLPAIETCGGKIEHTLVVVDRQQGGKSSLEAQGVSVEALVTIGPEFFHQARQIKQIDAKQEKQLLAFFESPERYMLEFLAAHPGFLEWEERRDEKTAERVRLFRSLKLGYGENQT